MRVRAVLLCAVGVWASRLPLAISEVPSTVPAAGLRDGFHAAHAFTGARIVVAPDKVIERGTLVVRDGVILAVGADAEPPADARVWRLEGRTIYPGFIDACAELSAEASKLGT